jgi:LPS-assembly lipoprotein
MWWYKSLVALVAVLFLGACGYQPLYGGGKNNPLSKELASISVKPIADRTGQQLRNELFDVLTPLGQPARPKYFLEVTLREGISGLAVKKSEVATRANLRLGASYKLFEVAGNRPVFSGDSTLVGSFNILNSDFSNLAASQGVRDRLIADMASDIQIRISAFFKLPRANSSQTKQ